MKDTTIYKLLIINQNKKIEMYAKHIYQSDIFGFIEVEDFVFNQNPNQLVVNPAEESLRKEFEGVKRSFMPVQSILRIDEVSKKGELKISEFKKSDKTPDSPIFPFSSHRFPTKPTSE